MLRYIAERTAIAIALVWFVATLVFMVLHLVPGDPAELLLSHGGIAADPTAVELLREQMGLNRPLLVQYADYLGGLLRGDLGHSLQDGRSVAAEVGLRLPRTLELIIAAALIAAAAGVPLGTSAALRAGGTADRIVSVLASAALSTPVFVVGTLLILLFAQTLQLLPAGGHVAFTEDPAQHLALLLMPALTIAVPLWAVIVRMTRSSVLETLERDHVRTARAKGLPPGGIVRRHVVRNAMVPVVTVLGLQLGALLGGTVLVEFVFNWPGLSGYLVRSVEARDYPEVVGIVLTISILFVFLNLLVDLTCAALDPRVRLGR
jgi:peptide/nickel transport system permease protein